MKPKTKTKKSLQTVEKAQTADERRLQSIAAKKKEYRNHQNAIKAALANVDVKTNKKIVFDEGDEPNHDDTTETVPTRNGDVFRKQHLFDDSCDDESETEYNFEVKEQFQGKKGKKLLELQSKYKNDKRFLLDERFLEEEDGKSNRDDKGTSTAFIQKKEMDENDLSEEKQAEFAILEEVLNTKVHKKSEENKKASTKSMLRYDPSKPEHANFILTKTEGKVVKKRKRKESDKVLEEENKGEELPEVSKETFYEVKQNFKESLQENHTVSLLNMFGRHEEPEKKNQLKETKDVEVIEKNTFANDKNPFRYDSSDNELDGEDKNEQDVSEEIKNNQDATASQKHINLGPRKLWTEPFFFQEDDYRFQEGFDFVRRFEVEDTEFSQVRRNIKEIVRAKVRHNQKKNKLFKKKLGGKKLIKMKKALKR